MKKNPDKLIQLYLDGALDEPDRIRFEQLLHDDAGTRAELEAYQKMRGALKTASEPRGEISRPDFMWSRIKEGILKGEGEAGPEGAAKERTPWWNWDYRWAFSGVAALAMLALALIYVVWMRQETLVSLPNFLKQGYSRVTVYTFDPDVYPSEYLSLHAEANVIWLTGVDAYEPAPGEKS